MSFITLHFYVDALLDFAMSDSFPFAENCPLNIPSSTKSVCDTICQIEKRRRYWDSLSLLKSKPRYGRLYDHFHRFFTAVLYASDSAPRHILDSELFTKLYPRHSYFSHQSYRFSSLRLTARKEVDALCRRFLYFVSALSALHPNQHSFINLPKYFTYIDENMIQKKFSILREELE